MPDIYNRDLLTVAEEALQPPVHLAPMQLAEWHVYTLCGRLPLIRKALRIAREENGAELATLLVDQAFAEYPNPPREIRAAGGDGARVPLPAQRAPSAPSSFDGGLPVAEHILCPLLYRSWNLTVEGLPPHEQYVARRPIGWSGEGDPFERITAPTRHELLRLLGYRLLGISSPPAD